MTNYNKRLDEILAKLHQQYEMQFGMHKQQFNNKKIKQAITLLTKELVAEAKPSKKHIGDEVAENRSYTGERLFNATIDEYHSNLLKALDEV